MTEKRVFLLSEQASPNPNLESRIINGLLMQNNKTIGLVKSGKQIVDSKIYSINKPALTSVIVGESILRPIKRFDNQGHHEIRGREIPILNHYLEINKRNDAFVFLEHAANNTTQIEMIQHLESDGVPFFINENIVPDIKTKIQSFSKIPFAQVLYKDMKNQGIDHVPYDNFSAYYIAQAVNSYINQFLKLSKKILPKVKHPEQLNRLNKKISQYMNFNPSPLEMVDLGIKSLVCDAKKQKKEIKNAITKGHYYAKTAAAKKLIDSHTHDVKNYLVYTIRKYKSEIADYLNKFHQQSKDTLQSFVEGLVHTAELHHADLSEQRHTLTKDNKLISETLVQDRSTQLLKTSLDFVACVMYRDYRQRAGKKSFLTPRETVGEFVQKTKTKELRYNSVFISALHNLVYGISPEKELYNLIEKPVNEKK